MFRPYTWSCGPIDGWKFRLSKSDERDLRQLLRSGVQQVRVVLRALALLELSDGQSAPGVARNLELTPKAVRDIGWRYMEGGLGTGIIRTPETGRDTVTEHG